MTSDREKVRLIFGLKMRQLRTNLQLSTYELAEKTGMSPSYLNEIEKGKKYPKTEKIFILAKVLETDYDSLVSLQVNKQLEPVVDLLQSDKLSDLPLSLFGIEPSYFLEIMANAPTKLSAFINTLIEIGRNYDLRVEQFYFSVLRTYQSLHDNYFEDLEESVASFISENKLPERRELYADWLRSTLIEKFGCAIEAYDAETKPALTILRSVYLPEKNKLLLNKKLSLEQKSFTLAREVAYRQLNIKVRPLESSMLEARSFDEVLNNFRASYFARAILIPRNHFLQQLEPLFQQNQWQPDKLLAMMEQFSVTPEMFLLRMTNILSSFFGLKELYFLRYNSLPDNRFELSKELHLSKLHTPHGVARNEHYCRRQVSVTILNELYEMQQAGSWDGRPICRAQRMTFASNKNAYFVFSIAKSSPPSTGNSSINIGFPIDDNLRKAMPFFNDPAIPDVQVGGTCERCQIENCEVRAAASTILHIRKQRKAAKACIQTLRFE
jgi:transcriptional regulator with XRE-family HTH domain